MSGIPGDPPARHRAVAGRFTDAVRGDHRLGRPDTGAGVGRPRRGAPPRRVVPGLPRLGSGIRLPEGPSVDDDPVGAWQTHADAVQALLDDPATPGAAFSDPHTGEMPLDVAVDRFYTSDVFMHTWDLARATGQDDALDPALCAELLAGMEPIDELLRSLGPVRAPGAGARRRARCRTGWSPSSVATRPGGPDQAVGAPSAGRSVRLIELMQNRWSVGVS